MDLSGSLTSSTGHTSRRPPGINPPTSSNPNHSSPQRSRPGRAENGVVPTNTSNGGVSLNRPAQRSVGMGTRPRGVDTVDGGASPMMPEQPSSIKATEPGSVESARIKGQASRDSMNSKRSVGRKNSSDMEHSGKTHIRRISDASIENSDRRNMLLQAFKSNLDALRSLTACKICTRLLYEPYTVSCGHTFCYSCLCQWFAEHRSKKSCPECRTDVTHPPAPAYLVREMVESLIVKAELLPSDESVEEHRKLKHEETQCVEKDKANKDKNTGGLFRGCFRPELLSVRAIRDEEDGVDRCPVCTWELEDGCCGRCGASFSSDGGAVLGRGSFSSFSDYESTIAYLSDEDIDADLDMEDAVSELGFGYGSASRMSYSSSLDGSSIYSLQIQREMASGNIQRPSRPASRSSYGSRVRRYSQSVISDRFTEDDGSMATVEEEEEDEDEDMESLADFIVPDDSRNNTPGSHTPSPQVARQSRRVSHIDLRSPSLGAASVNEEEFDEGGAISNGRQRRSNRPRTASRRKFGPIALSMSTDAEGDLQELDEDTLALLQHPYTQLDHDDGDDAMDFDPDDDDDDAKTTVGTSPPPFENERTRLGGSITPTAAQANAAIRPPSRNRGGSSTGLRGLRRKGSSISVSNYEDGEADDDDSENEEYFNNLEKADKDGDVDMTNPSNGAGRGLSSSSVIRLSSAEPDSPKRGLSVGDAIDLDSDSASDVPVRSQRRRRPQNSRTPEYNPRISLMFAQHQSDLNSINSIRRGTDAEVWETPQRMMTPIARPRTANRNRPAATTSVDPTDSAFAAALAAGSPVTTRSRAGSQNNWSSAEASSLTNSGADRIRASPQTRISSISGFDGPVHQQTITRSDVNPQISLANQNEGHLGQNRIITNAINSPSRLQNNIERPPSRASAAPAMSPSHGRSGGIPSLSLGRPIFPTQQYRTGFIQPSPGFNHHLQQQHPWSHLLQQRQSHARLREVPSNSTLRARHSRTHLRNNPSHSNMRDANNNISRRSSRTSLTRAPSQQRLRAENSTRALQPGQRAPSSHLEGSPTIPNPTPSSNGTNSNKVTPNQLSNEERKRRGQEVIRQRQEELTSRRQSRPELNPAPNNTRPQEALIQQRLSATADQGASFSARSEASRASSVETATNISLGRQQPRRTPRLPVTGQAPVTGSVTQSATTTGTGSMRTGPGTSINSRDSVSPPHSPFMPRVR